MLVNQQEIQMWCLNQLVFATQTTARVWQAAFFRWNGSISGVLGCLSQDLHVNLGHVRTVLLREDSFPVSRRWMLLWVWKWNEMIRGERVKHRQAFLHFPRLCYRNSPLGVSVRLFHLNDMFGAFFPPCATSVWDWIWNYRPFFPACSPPPSPLCLHQ